MVTIHGIRSRKQIAVSNHQMEDFLKISRDHSKSIQQLPDKAKMNSIRLIRINEKSGESTKDIRTLFTEVNQKNSQA